MDSIVFYSGSTILRPVKANLRLASYSPSSVEIELSTLNTTAIGDKISVFSVDSFGMETLIISLTVRDVDFSQTETGIVYTISGIGTEDYSGYQTFIYFGGDAAEFSPRLPTVTKTIRNARSINRSGFQCALDTTLRPNMRVNYGNEQSAIANSVTMELNSTGGNMSIGF